MLRTSKRISSSVVLPGIMFFVMLFAGTNVAFSQCPLPGTNVGSVSVAGFTASSSASITLQSMQYFTLTGLEAGKKYRLSTCGISWDSELTVRSVAGDIGLAFVDDAGTACGGTPASMDYTGNVSYPNVNVVLTKYVSGFCGTETGFTATVVITLAPPPPPASVTVSSNPICSGASTQLTANGASGTVYWYTGSCGGTEIGTGNPINVNPSSTTTYYARNYDGKYSDICASNSVTVYPTPSVTNSSTAAICSGTSPNISLTANTTSSFSWTVGSITGSISGANAGSGSSINEALTNPSNYTAGLVPYIVTPYSNPGGCPGSPYTITVTVYPTPPAVTGLANQTVTGAPNSVTFNVTNGGAPNTIQWSTDGTNTNGTVGTPNILSLTYPASPVVVYARLYNASTTCIGPWSLPYYGTAYNPSAPPVIGSTRYGQSNGSGSSFINKNGKPGDIPLLSNYGKDFSLVSTDLSALTISLASVVPGGSGASSFSRITVSSTPVLARGVCWSLASGPDPVITNSHTVDGSGVVDYTSTISEPVSGTYKVRAWAINSSGLHYSNVLSVVISGGK